MCPRSHSYKVVELSGKPERAYHVYELAKSLIWFNTLCMRLNRRGESVNCPGELGRECTRNISHHEDIMVLFTSSSKSSLHDLGYGFEVKQFYVRCLL